MINYGSIKQLHTSFQFYWQLQVDPDHAGQGVFQQSGSGQPRHSQQASGSQGGDASQDQGPLRLQELEAGARHHGKLESPQHCLLTRGRLCRRLLLPGPGLLPWRQPLRYDWRPGGVQAGGGGRQVPLQTDPGGTRLPAQQEHHPPRHQAGEHPAGQDPEEGCYCGLWAEQLLGRQLKIENSLWIC